MYVRVEANIAPVSPVAIVGAALRFPGAADPASFHELTIAGRRMFRELAAAVPGHGHGAGHEQGLPLRPPPSSAALLDHEDVAGDWDPAAAASGITARHVLAADTVAAALADVALSARAVAPDRIGVIVADIPEPDTRHAGDWVRERLGLTGSATAGKGAAAEAATGVAGPQCSLRAVVAGCEALNAGEFDLVVVGGVNMGVGHGGVSGTSEASPPTDDVRVYDASPSGMLPGEGSGAVALMRAADARAGELPAYAEIVGWHTADGDGPMSLRPAYLRAGVDPTDVQLVEGHGAATAADDLAELSALLDVLGPRARCALGAVSANIGDTRGAAGIAALLKTALAMTAGTIPPATGCVRPHPLLAAGTAPLRVPAVAEPWPDTAVQLAAVNSLGTVARHDAPRSGVVHVVLRRERDSGYPVGRRRRAASASADDTPRDAGSHLDVPAPRRAAGAHVAPPPRPRMPEDTLLGTAAP